MTQVFYKRGLAFTYSNSAELGTTVIGKGDVDIRGVFSVLKNGGYNGWISLEPLAGGKEDLRFSVGYVKDAWNKA